MRQLSLLLFCLLLQACTQTQKGLMETARLAVNGPDDVTVSDEQVQALPYASMYAHINQGPRIFVVLGFNENGEQKWVTQDRAMLVTRHGRLVKTLGLPDNLHEVSNLSQDPLADGLHLQQDARWTRILRWSEQDNTRAGIAVSHFSRGADEVLNLAGERVPCRVWHETVRMDARDQVWENTFWIDNRSGEVVQAQQMLGAGTFPIVTTLLKPAKS